MKQMIQPGQKFTNNDGCGCVVKEVKSYQTVFIEFLDDHGHTSVVRVDQLRNGNYRNPYAKTVFKVGCIGFGKHPAYIKGSATRAYNAWVAMLKRCYDFSRKDAKWYAGCEVDPGWHNYQEFCDWFCSQPGCMEDFELDKDLLSPGSKVYGPDTCCLVPQEINKLLSSRSSCRGEFPIGVSRKGDKFQAKVNMRGEQCYLGVYATPEAAFMAYKSAKERHIRDLVMNDFRDSLRDDVKNSLLAYRVKIDD